MPKKNLPKSNNAHHEKIANKVIERIESFEHQFRDKMVVLIVSAFGLVAAFSWNDLIREIIDNFVPGEDVVLWRVFTAVMITVIAVITTMLLSHVKPIKKKE